MLCSDTYPEKFIVAMVTPGIKFELQNNIVEIEDCTGKIP